MSPYSCTDISFQISPKFVRYCTCHRILFHCTCHRIFFYTVPRGGGLGSSTIFKNLMSPTPRRKWYLTTGRRAHEMVLDPIPQSLPVHFFGSRPQPPTSHGTFVSRFHVCQRNSFQTSPKFLGVAYVILVWVQMLPSFLAFMDVREYCLYYRILFQTVPSFLGIMYVLSWMSPYPCTDISFQISPKFVSIAYIIVSYFRQYPRS